MLTLRASAIEREYSRGTLLVCVGLFLLLAVSNAFMLRGVHRER